MKKYDNLLKIAVWSVIGVFIGTSLYRCYDYYAHPELYVMMSAPWYLSIQMSGLITLVIVMLLLIAMRIVKKKNG